MRPPERETPQNIAREVLGVTGNGTHPLSWEALADIAARLYWQNRPAQSPGKLAEYRRRQVRNAIPVEVWLRRGAA